MSGQNQENLSAQGLDKQAAAEQASSIAAVLGYILDAIDADDVESAVRGIIELYESVVAFEMIVRNVMHIPAEVIERELSAIDTDPPVIDADFVAAEDDESD